MGKKRTELIGPISDVLIGLSEEASRNDCDRIRSLLNNPKKFALRRVRAEGVDTERWKASKEDALAFSKAIGPDRSLITIDVLSVKTGKFHRISVQAEEDVLNPKPSTPAKQ